MALIGFPHNFLQGLSDFWQRFFADSPQLSAMYDGTAILMGQVYLDMLTNVLNVSIVDAPVFNKSFYKLVLVREDQVHFENGASSTDDRWVFPMPDNIVSFRSLDNRVIEPTVTLQEAVNYEVNPDAIRFKIDPTNPTGTGDPLPGFARRQIDVLTGGKFDDTARLVTDTWQGYGVKKGDTLRILDVGSPDSTGAAPQFLRADYLIDLVRPTALYVATTTPFKYAGAVNYVILRKPFNDFVQVENLYFQGTQDIAQLAHGRLVKGSIRVYAKRAFDGQDVVEGVDYTVDYERGRILRTTAWQATSALKIDYRWMQEIWPYLTGQAPRYSSTGTLTLNITTRVTQMALWAPDALVDHLVLANNFGSLIGFEEKSSESYRAFLRGIFQLYLSGPVLERMESALNVILGLPVIRDDGELLISVAFDNVTFNRVTTKRSTGTIATYDFPKATPLRKDIQDTANWSKLTFASFDVLSAAIRVTDYIQDPAWWHNIVIPQELFSKAGPAVVPDIGRRTVSPMYVRHVVGPDDMAKVGDPGLVVGMDDQRNPIPTGHKVFRHRMAFVVMDRFLKAHMFFVHFHESVFSDNQVGAKYARNIDDLNNVIFSAKPAHTFIFVQPSTTFVDTVIAADTGVFQPQNFLGADVNAPEVYPDPSLLPGQFSPFIILGVFLKPSVHLNNQVIWQDTNLSVSTDWKVGDFFRYELLNIVQDFAGTGVPVTLNGAPTAPRRGRFVRVQINITRNGRALVENIDYAVNYTARTVTPLTAWDSTLAVSITLVQLNIGNNGIGGAVPDLTQGDTYYSLGTITPHLVRAAYDPTRRDAFDQLIPVADHEDFSFVERALTIRQF